jgi:hypothetical protein
MPGIHTWLNNGTYPVTLLLAVEADQRIPGGQKPPRRLVDEPELRVPVRVRRAFPVLNTARNRYPARRKSRATVR